MSHVLMWRAADAGGAVAAHRIVKYGDADGKVGAVRRRCRRPHRGLRPGVGVPRAGVSRSPRTGIADIEYGANVARGAAAHRRRRRQGGDRSRR